MFELDPVPARTRSNQDVGSRDRNAGGTRTARQIESGIPNSVVDGELRQESLEISKHLLITLAACAIPEF